MPEKLANLVPDAALNQVCVVDYAEAGSCSDHVDLTDQQLEAHPGLKDVVTFSMVLDGGPTAQALKFPWPLPGSLYVFLENAPIVAQMVAPSLAISSFFPAASCATYHRVLLTGMSASRSRFT